MAKEGVSGYGESSGDMADDVRFKMVDWRPFCFSILMFFAHNSKTNRDSHFVFVLKKRFWGMANLVVIFPMMSDS